MSKSLPILTGVDDSAEDISRSGNAISGTRRSEVPVSRLVNNIEEFMSALNPVLEKFKSKTVDGKLREVNVSLSIGSEGKVSLFGTGASVSGEASISLKFEL